MSDAASVIEQRTASIDKLVTENNSSLPSRSLSSRRPSVVMEEESRKTEEEWLVTDAPVRPSQAQASNILCVNTGSDSSDDSDEDDSDTGNVKARRSIKRQYM